MSMVLQTASYVLWILAFTQTRFSGKRVLLLVASFGTENFTIPDFRKLSVSFEIRSFDSRLFHSFWHKTDHSTFCFPVNESASGFSLPSRTCINTETCCKFLAFSSPIYNSPPLQ